MKYILDTHVILWIAENSSFLTDKVKSIILDEDAEIFVSIASAWEVAIKLGTTKLHLDGGLPEFFRIIDDNGFITLSVERDYLNLIPQLPDYHKDPFDRLIIATAIIENMTLVTADENIHRYNVLRSTLQLMISNITKKMTVILVLPVKHLFINAILSSNPEVLQENNTE